MSAARGARRRWRCAAAAACALLGPTGCSSDPREGYSFTSAYDPDRGPIAVSMWENRTFTHGLESLVTEAIAKEVVRTTPWKVTSSDLARSTLTGVITSIELRPLSTANVSGLMEDIAVEITADFEWRSSGTGRLLAARRGFRSVASFVPAQGVGERIEVGQDQAVQKLARDVVATLRTGW